MREAEASSAILMARSALRPPESSCGPLRLARSRPCVERGFSLIWRRSRRAGSSRVLHRPPVEGRRPWLTRGCQFASFGHSQRSKGALPRMGHRRWRRAVSVTAAHPQQRRRVNASVLRRRARGHFEAPRSCRATQRADRWSEVGLPAKTIRAGVVSWATAESSRQRRSAAHLA